MSRLQSNTYLCKGILSRQSLLRKNAFRAQQNGHIDIYVRTMQLLVVVSQPSQGGTKRWGWQPGGPECHFYLHRTWDHVRVCVERPMPARPVDDSAVEGCGATFKPLCRPLCRQQRVHDSWYVYEKDERAFGISLLEALEG